MKTRNDLLKELSERLSRNIVTLIYNDNSEIEKNDLNRIKKFLDKIDSEDAFLILHGKGGDSATGKAIAITLRKKFKNGMVTIVPKRTSSALLHTVLISRCVYISKNSIITPIDPCFYHNGEYLQACHHMNHPKLHRKAKRYWEYTANFCINMLSTPGAICNKDKLTLDDIEVIVRKLLLPATHDSTIGYKDLKEMDFAYELVKNEDPDWKLIQYIVDGTLRHLKEHHQRFIIDSSCISSPNQSHSVSRRHFP